MMAEVPLEAHDLRQLRLWRRIIYDLYDKYGEVFEEYGYGNELRDALNNLDNLLNTLSTKLPYELKLTRVREFLRELDRFRVAASRYFGKIAEQLYRDVRDVIDGVFNFDVEGDVEDG
jgi:hypothetical protein